MSDPTERVVFSLFMFSVYVTRKSIHQRLIDLYLEESKKEAHDKVGKNTVLNVVARDVFFHAEVVT